MTSNTDSNYLILVSVFIFLLSVAGVYLAWHETGEETSLEEEAAQCYEDSVNDTGEQTPDWNSSNYSEYYDEELKACLDPKQHSDNRS